ncbi:MAG: peptide chain release factor N(5)-glutamine methyltransferase [Bacteroidales bacterium]|nr:peptide chain release factor N(5)-glutamine methyltransferase [Bacteroidales bacterium]
MLVAEFIHKAKEALASLYPDSEANAIALRLVSDKLQIPAYKHLTEPATTIPADKADELQRALDELKQGRPLQYVLGHTEFAGLKLKVKEGCLIPRPETEELYVYAAKSCEKKIESIPECDTFNILDICTGSGALAYAFAADFPQAQVYACDISQEALAIACKQRVKCIKPVFFQADILQTPPSGLPQFDLIVSNPPYICESERAQMHQNVLDYEPSIALFVPDSDPLLFYRAIAQWAEQLLKPTGEIWMEINERFGAETAALFKNGMVLKDIREKDRFIHVARGERKNG